MQSQANWLQADPNQGTLLFGTGDIPVSVRTDGLERGIYLDTLSFTDANASNSPVAVTVILRIRGKLSVPQDYASIREAVNAAVAGETIEVSSGTYYESIDLDKPLVLRGLDEPNLVSLGSSSVIDQSNTADGKPIYYLTNVIDTVISHMDDPACVYLVDCSDITLFNLNLRNNGKGICLVNTDNTTIRRVTISDCQAGLWLEDAPNNRLIDNSVSRCDRGIMLLRAPDTVMQQNLCVDNQHGFTCESSNADDFRQSIDVSNTIDNIPIYYLVDQQDLVLDGNTPASCIYAIGCSQLDIREQVLTKNGYGMVLRDRRDISVESVTATQNEHDGILLRGCRDVSIAFARLTQNDRGLYLDECESIQVKHARISHNGTGVHGDRSGYTLLNGLIRENANGGGVRHHSHSQRPCVIKSCTIVNNRMGNSSWEDEGGGITGEMSDLPALCSRRVSGMRSQCPAGMSVGCR